MRPSPQSLGTIRILMISLLLCGLTGVAHAQVPPTPQGAVVLTVSGIIDNPNRGPLDALEQRESLFKYHEIAFERAAQFDVAALERLGVHNIVASHPDWPQEFTFEGPLLRDVLAAAGATGSVVRVLALDGYAAEIPMSEIQVRPFIVALKRDGRYLGIGDQGPTWVIAPPNAGEESNHEQGSKWVWAAFHIAVE